MNIFVNPHSLRIAPPSNIKDTINASVAAQLLGFLAHCPAYHPTPLHELNRYAKLAGVGAVYYKDESQRFSLQSFKALGATYAVAKVVHRLHWPERDFDPAPLFEAQARALQLGLLPVLLMAIMGEQLLRELACSVANALFSCMPA